MISCEFENGSKTSLRHVTVDAVVATKDGKIVLVKRGKGIVASGKWSLPGGYVERDETLEQAVEREVLEETGWKVKNIKLLKVRDETDVPDEDRQNISFFYVCEADKKIQAGDDESDDAKWFLLEELPPKEQIAFDHADNIELYRTSVK